MAADRAISNIVMIVYKFATKGVSTYTQWSHHAQAID